MTILPYFEGLLIFYEILQGSTQSGCDYFEWFYDEFEDEKCILIMKQKSRLKFLTKYIEEQGQKLVVNVEKIE